MEKVFKDGLSEIMFSDFSSDKDCEIELHDTTVDQKLYYYLSKENIIELRDHLNYLIKQF